MGLSDAPVKRYLAVMNHTAFNCLVERCKAVTDDVAGKMVAMQTSVEEVILTTVGVKPQAGHDLVAIAIGDRSEHAVVAQWIYLSRGVGAVHVFPPPQ